MMIRRVLAAASVASLSFASFAGCAEDPPAPVRSSSACSPRSADVTWSSGAQGALVLVGAYLLRYERHPGKWVTLSATPVQVDPVWDDGDLGVVAETAAQRRAWESDLLARAARTGQTRGPFGGSYPLPDESPAEPSKPDHNTYVATISVHRYTIPFSIECPDGRSRVSGTVSAPDYSELNAALFVCGEPATSNESRIALGFCR